MKRAVFIILLTLLPVHVFGGIGGDADKRRVIGWVDSKPAYVSANQKNMWNTDPYNKIVFISNRNGLSGTGEFISPKHILTNIHVAKYCGTKDADGTVRKKCKITTSDGAVLDASVVMSGAKENEKQTGKFDWSILEVENYCSKNYFKYTTYNYIPTSVFAMNLWQSGFGDLRVLSETDIDNIRAAYRVWVQYSNTTPNNWNNMFHNNVELKSISTKKDQYKIFFDAYRNITGKDFLTDCFNDSHTLKRNDKCSVSGSNKGLAKHDCQTWHGDSGSTLQTSSNEIVMLHRGGAEYITRQDKFLNEGPVAGEIFSRPEVIELLSKPCRINGK